MTDIKSQTFVFSLIPIVTILVLGLIAYFKWKLRYWDETGLPTLPTKFLLGNTKDLILGNKTFGEQFRDLYLELKSRGYKQHAGVYLGAKPIYMPIDPEIIKHIIQNDFEHFVNRGNYVNEKVDPLSGHLITLGGDKWRNLRVKLTPTFTSGKMKMMFQTLADCAFGLKDKLDEASGPVNIKELLACFATDVIGSAAFGLECNSLKNPDVDFRSYGKRHFQDSALERLRLIGQFMIPDGVLKAINFKIIKEDVASFFLNVIRQTVEYREKNNIYRKDFLHLLLQLKNRGVVKDDGKIFDDDRVMKNGLSFNELAAQCFVFFIAGFETSSTAMSFALFELAIHQEIQERLREEIIAVVKRHDNKLTYEGVKEMTYMNNVLFEILRKHPPVPILNRKCTKDYTIPGTSITLKEGTQVFIPSLGLHHDPEYYPDPQKFDPERFSPGNKNSRPDFTWLPFGEGPRSCIGLRFAIMESAVGLASVLQSYKIRLSPKTILPLTIDPNSFITAAKEGIWLDIEKIG